MSVVVYSAIYGRYDRPKQVPPDLGAPAIMFTDDDYTANLALDAGWDVIRTVTLNDAITPMMRHKWFKLHPEEALPSFDVSLWLDGSMTITVPNYVELCMDALGDDDWVMVPHPSRTCVFDEAAFSARLERYDGPALMAQSDYYRNIGHPPGWGLFATGANVRRHTPVVRKVCDDWWFENENRTHQDQVSLPVLVRLAGDELRWNLKMPWHGWWHLSEHGG